MGINVILNGVDVLDLSPVIHILSAGRVSLSSTLSHVV